MADVSEATQPAENSASTPTSNPPPSSNSRNVVKDRPCPFCGQAFTSSSLGRHLDLYIKPHNPKPPDGVHDVDEIQKMRGGITRRQPRTGMRSGSGSGSRYSRGNRQDEADTSTPTNSRNKSVFRNVNRNRDSTSGVSPSNFNDSELATSAFKMPTWQATGIMSNLPPRESPRSSDVRRDAAGDKTQRPEGESESMWKLQEAAEVGRAAEMALREVLGSLEAAQKKTEPKVLFPDFDFFALSFPGLCLAILPHPSTLFSSAPFASADSWALGPPGQRQYEVTIRYVNEALAARHMIEHIPDSVGFKYHSHLSGAWEHWQSMTENDRASTWTLEILRAYTKTEEQKKQLQSELEASQQHARHLEAEYDRLSRCQLPREYLVHPPNTIRVPPETLREARPSHLKSSMITPDYDAETLISKWRSTVRETMRSSKIGQSSVFDSGSSYAQTSENALRANLIMNGSVWGVNGPMPRPTQDRPATGGAEDNSYLAYQTPAQSGMVISTDNDNDEDEDADADASDADADGEPDLEPSNVIAPNAATGPITTRSHFDSPSRPSPSNGMMNGNGKRPLAPTPTSGRPYSKYRTRNNE